MSYAADRRWEIEREQKRQLYLDRIRRTTEEFAERNRERINSLVEQELDVFVSKELAICSALLDEVDRNLWSDPERARDANIRLSKNLKPLFSIARSNRRADQIAQREEERRARELARADEIEKLRIEKDQISKLAIQVEELRADIEESIVEFINTLPDVATKDFAYESIELIRADLNSAQITLQEISNLKSHLNQRLDMIKIDARDKAREWRVRNETNEVAEQISAADSTR